MRSEGRTANHVYQSGLVDVENVETCFYVSHVFAGYATLQLFFLQTAASDWLFRVLTLRTLKKDRLAIVAPTCMRAYIILLHLLH